MNELKQNEIDVWKKWKATNDPVHANFLLKSLDPFLQSYVNKYSAAPLPRPAIESEARLLALKAFGTYNPKMGTQLSTHVGHELKHLHRYVLDYQNVGKIPENRGIAISKFKNVKSHLAEKLNREPTVIELADDLTWSPAEVERMQSELRADLNVIQGKEEAFFDSQYNMTDHSRDVVEFVYWSSPPQDQKIMEYWFGIGGGPKLSVDEIAKKLRKTPEQIKESSKLIANTIHQNLY
ncbi:MAG: sigma-70 domain-containing protein [Candidatus Paceibacterota bacterium]|jgi:RNA polymerase primary sigma factor